MMFAILNLLPILPLDGGRIVASLLPGKRVVRYSRTEPYGIFVLLALVFTGLLGKLLGRPWSRRCAPPTRLRFPVRKRRKEKHVPGPRTFRMRPTGAMHLGHYHGALKNWVKLQNEFPCLFFAADWHALTTHYEDPAVIEQDRLGDVRRLARGRHRPDKSTLFIQSRVPQHAELTMLLAFFTPLAWLERVPTYKDLVEQHAERGRDVLTYGFLGYPLMQAADIMIYRANRCRWARTRCRTSSSRARSRAASTTLRPREGLRGEGRGRGEEDGAEEGEALPLAAAGFQEQGDRRRSARRAQLVDDVQNLSLGDKERLYGYIEGGGRMILAEPEALLTETPKLLGLDGQKMSKSYDNASCCARRRARSRRRSARCRRIPRACAAPIPASPRSARCGTCTRSIRTDDAGVGVKGCRTRGHRLPRVQAAGDRRDQRGARSPSASAPRSTRRTRPWCATSSRTAARRPPTSPTRRCATCAKRWA
jgi:tryptophanyl-tRNA synthetase